MTSKRLTVDITFCLKPTEEGGRRTPIFSRYRPNWDIGRVYDGKPWLFADQLELLGADLVAPGECGAVHNGNVVPASSCAALPSDCRDLP